jgi:hypothetical protein
MLFAWSDHMKRARFALAAAVLLASAPVFAQTTVSGDWDVTIQSPQGANTVRVTLKQDGEKVTGIFKSPQGELPFEGGTLTGNELKFAFSVPFQGAPLQITLTGKVEGESVTGKADFGGFAEGDWSAKRVDAAAAAATASAAPAAATGAPAAPTAAAAMPAASSAAGASTGVNGKWDVTLKTQMGDVPATAEFTDAGGKVTGTLTGPVGPMDVSGTFDGSAIKLTFTAHTPNGDIPVTMTGDLTGDQIAGKAEFGGMGNGEWSARRAKQ